MKTKQGFRIVVLCQEQLGKDKFPMGKIKTIYVILIMLTALIVNYSCFNRGEKRDIPPELSLRHENGKSFLVIGGKIATNWFYIFDNTKNIEIRKSHLSFVFERDVIPNVKMIIMPKELKEFQIVEVELEIVNNEKDADLESKIFLEKNKKYGLYLFSPTASYEYPIFYFIFDGKSVKLVD